MANLWAAFWLSFGVVFVAELGDKSQLMALTFATKYRPALVMTGIVAATVLINAISVGVGYGLGLALPTRWISLVAGLVFLGFALWTLRGEYEEDDEVLSRVGSGPVVMTVGSAFLLAELGDKTMLATITLASQNGWAGDARNGRGRGAGDHRWPAAGQAPPGSCGPLRRRGAVRRVRGLAVGGGAGVTEWAP